MCSSSGEITVSLRHLVLVTLKLSTCFRVTNTKFRIDTVISRDVGHIVARNTLRKGNKHTKKNCAPSWLYLQDYTGMYGQQNVKKKVVY
jgi:hypothetical protein